MTEYDFDAVIAGSGVAGAIAASLIASKGYRVALIESKASSLVGLKVCGDGVGLHDFHEAGIHPPTEEAERTVQGVKFYARPDEPTFTIRGKGVTLNRHAFGQRLLKEAQNHGAELFAENTVTRALLANDHVVGLVSKHAGGTNTFKASLILDATGIAGAVRTTLPTSWPISETANRLDVGLGYRQYRRLTKEFEDYCSLYYNWDLARGGYCWIIPKRNHLVNTGLLIPWRHQTSAGKLESNFEEFIRQNLVLKDSRLIRSEIGLVPLRHPLSSAVANGLIAIGDAAYHANPLNGDGIGSAMSAARIAADTAVSCLQMDDTSLKSLWKFNVEYMRKQGCKYTVNKLLGDFIRSLSSDHMVMFFEALGVRREYSSGDLFGELSLREKASIFLNMSCKPSLMFRLLALVRRMDRVLGHCREFPKDPSHFPSWLMRLEQELQ